MTNKKIKSYSSVSVELAILETKMDAMRVELHEVKEKLDAKYVTAEQFEPIKKIVYGLVSLILIAVVSAVVRIILT